MAKERTFTIPANLMKKFEEWKENLPKKGYDDATIGVVLRLNLRQQVSVQKFG